MIYPKSSSKSVILLLGAILTFAISDLPALAKQSDSTCLKNASSLSQQGLIIAQRDNCRRVGRPYYVTQRGRDGRRVKVRVCDYQCSTRSRRDRPGSGRGELVQRRC